MLRSKYIFLLFMIFVSTIILPFEDYPTYANSEVLERERPGKDRDHQRKAEIYKQVVKINIQDVDVAEHHTTESIIQNIPTPILDMYKQIGGKIEIISDNLNDHPILSHNNNRQYKDIEGNTVSLANHYVYSHDGENPTVLIKASNEYGENYVHDRNVYYEIGKAIARDVFKQTPKWMVELVPIFNQIRGDEDGKNLLFTDVMKSYNNQFDETFLTQHPDDVQEVFARAFGYYFEPHSRSTLETYNQEMFNYMKKMDESGFEDYNKLLKNIILIDFGNNETRAKEWGTKNFKEWIDSLRLSERKALFDYTTGNGMDLSAIINDYLEKKSTPSSSDVRIIKEHISEMDTALDRAKLSQKMIVYRRVHVEEINKTGREYEDNDLRKGNKLDTEVVNKLSEKLQNCYMDYKRYISTSASKDPSEGVFSDRPVLLRMELPVGTHAGYLGDISGFPGELEVLIKRGYSFKVTGVSIISTEEKETLQVNLKLIK
ncbi:ADP-ribosyltransferase [Bacillus cereus]|uniref:ADP-ribosyltransferase n=1 Tax=Bacillus cereus TaxID=1396 RepID=UPI000279C9BB|nr:ADP-ribosyltransferase [Bacillus cereus]EJR89572.1 hypothetical protein IKG_06107 [Bacillus cereus VD200]